MAPEFERGNHKWTEPARGSAAGNEGRLAVLAIDQSGRAIYCNGVAETMIGWPLLEVIGRPYDLIFKLQDVAKPRFPRLSGMTGGDKISVTTPASVLMVLHRSGFEAPIEHRRVPIHGRDGQVVGAMITFRYLGNEQ